MLPPARFSWSTVLLPHVRVLTSLCVHRLCAHPAAGGARKPSVPGRLGQFASQRFGSDDLAGFCRLAIIPAPTVLIIAPREVGRRGIIESCVWERGKCVHSEGDKTRPTKAKTERTHEQEQRSFTP